MRICFIFVLTASLAGPLLAADSADFRGPTRDGIFTETGLMKSWPEEGPKQNWAIDGLGKGFSSVSVVGDSIYTTGKIDDSGYVFAIDMKGTLKWKTVYGAEDNGGNYPGARSTPTYSDGKLYLISGVGVAVCLDASTGKILWSVDTLERFGGGADNSKFMPRWSIAESVLVTDNMVICTPGATDASVVALNKNNGETIWQSKGISEVSGYCSARIFDNGTVRQLVTMTGHSLLALDLKTGNKIWHQPYAGDYDIHANSPLFFGNMIYVTDGYKRGGAMFQLAEDGKSVSQVWTEKSLSVNHGGAVLVNGKIYGANKSLLIGLDAKTGKVVGKGRATGKGSIIYCDGLLYTYGERGYVGLIDPNSSDFTPISQFRITQGSGQHWAHPVISGGNLYIRHGDVLMSFGIKE